MSMARVTSVDNAKKHFNKNPNKDVLCLGKGQTENKVCKNLEECESFYNTKLAKK